MEEVKREEKIEEQNNSTENNFNNDEDLKKAIMQTDHNGSNWWKYVLIILAIIIIILLLLRCCGKGKGYKIKIHNGDEIIEVDKDFKLSDLDVDGGIVPFLVDSDGFILEPNEKLNPDKEYSTHLIPTGKEKVKVTYINGDKKFSIDYQKGAGLLFPKIEKKKGFIFLGWKNEETNSFPAFMSPVNNDMTLVAQYVKPDIKGGICKENCDTNGDNICDLNCDKDGDGTPDTNVDKDGDGKPDTNVDKNGDNVCDLNCDKDGDGTPDTNVDKDGDGNPDTNIDTNGDNVCDLNCDNNNDNTCDTNCEEQIGVVSRTGSANYKCDTYPAVAVEGTEDTFISATLDNKEVKPDRFIYGKYAYFELTEYKGSGSTHEMEYKIILTDQTGQKYYVIYMITLTFEGNCDNKNEEPNEEPKEEPKDNPDNDNTNTSTTNNNANTNSNNNNSQNTNQNAVAPTPSQPKDNGTISLVARSTCLVSGESTTVFANVNNTNNTSVDWLADQCLSVSSSDNTATVSGRGCSANPKITGRLSNGVSDTVTFNFENELTYTVTTPQGTVAPYELGRYLGNSLTVSTNVPAYITGRYLLGDESVLRTSATTNGTAHTIVTIKTPCGQTETIEIYPVIN